MDEVIIEVYRKMVLEQSASVDDILECPILRDCFKQHVRQLLPFDLPERQLLHRFVYLRKHRKLPRSRDVKAGREQHILFGAA
jgi:hypothetical protein